MKLKGLQKTIKGLEELQEAVSQNIDDIDHEKNEDLGSSKDEMFNEAWNCIDTAIGSLKEIKEFRIEDF